jgi:formate dehydrogenase major subunit
MTYRVPGIHEETPNHFLEVSPQLAEQRELSSGQWVDITSRQGELRTQVLVTDRVVGNQLYAPLNSAKHPVNQLTSSNVDRETNTPAYKDTAVKIKALPWKGPNPLPPINFRYGHPTPQRGVEVERKWKRADYSLPGSGLVQIKTNGNRTTNNGKTN